MEIQNKIPGLISIEESTQPDGSLQFVFEIEDEKEAEFYAAFGLEPGDSAGFQGVLIEAINLLTERIKNA